MEAGRLFSAGLCDFLDNFHIAFTIMENPCIIGLVKMTYFIGNDGDFPIPSKAPAASDWAPPSVPSGGIFMLRNLKALRRSRRLNQQELAELLHISQASISKYEMGLVEPDIYIIKQIAAFFQVSIDDLLGEEKGKPLCKEDLSQEEKQFLDGYGRLTQVEKELVCSIMQERLRPQP